MFISPYGPFGRSASKTTSQDTGKVDEMEVVPDQRSTPIWPGVKGFDAAIALVFVVEMGGVFLVRGEFAARVAVVAVECS